MLKIKKILKFSIVSGAVFLNIIVMAVPLVNAQATILPKVQDQGKCDIAISKFEDGGISTEGGIGAYMKQSGTEVLACGIQTGRISLPMVPYFIKYFSNYLLGLISLLSLLFVVMGGFLYTSGGMTDQKDKGKKFITNALTGMVVAFLAWSIVNVILSVITG